MWDYAAFPVWAVPSDDSWQWSVESLGVSDSLRNDLQQWSDDWSAVMWGEKGPETAKPPTEEVFQAWDERGRTLLTRLRRELGARFEIGYFNEKTDQVEWGA
jgi:hypothetical protein